ncbi:MAG: hypothetical protein ACI9HK_003616 [Pirellulaceae bacterium]|jgi:hypothetical protein
MTLLIVESVEMWKITLGQRDGEDTIRYEFDTNSIRIRVGSGSSRCGVFVTPVRIPSLVKL